MGGSGEWGGVPGCLMCLGTEPTGPVAEFGCPGERKHHQDDSHVLIPTTEGRVGPFPDPDPDPSLARGPSPTPNPVALTQEVQTTLLDTSLCAPPTWGLCTSCSPP